MKKLISSVLVISFIGVPVVSGAFADKGLYPSSDMAFLDAMEQYQYGKKSTPETLAPAGNLDPSTKAFLDSMHYYQYGEKEGTSETQEYKTENENTEITKTIAVDNNENQNLENSVKREDKAVNNVDENKEEVSKVYAAYKKMTPVKKILIAAGIGAALAAGGCVAYNYSGILKFLKDCSIFKFSNSIVPKFKNTIGNMLEKFILGRILFFLGSLTSNYFLGEYANIISYIIVFYMTLFL